MTVVAMSHGELSRYDTLLRVQRRELRAQDAATLLELSRRQVSRLLVRLVPKVLFHESAASRAIGGIKMPSVNAS